MKSKNIIHNEIEKNLFPNKAFIIFDGKKFFGIYEKDFKKLKNISNLEIWEIRSFWSENMNKDIQKYNEDLI